MFQPLLRRLRLRRKTSAWASGGPVGATRLVACLGRWRALPCAARHAEFTFSPLYALKNVYGRTRPTTQSEAQIFCLAQDEFR
jgi:hypothetical protein